MSISISITPGALKKLNYLDYKARAKFVSKIRCFITQQAAADQIKKMHQQRNKNIFRIRYNLNQRIIARLVKIYDHHKQIRILDFVSHDEMDKGQYSTNDNNSTLINLDTLIFEIDEQENPNSSELTVNYSLETEDSDIINYDFFLPNLIYPEYQTDADLLFSPEQYAIAKSNLPILLTGSAGSGKTTIAVYQALQHCNYEEHQNRILYVTYSRYLNKYAKTIAGSFLEKIPKNLDFYDYDSLCISIGIKNKIIKNQNFDTSNKINQQKFIEKFWKNRAVAGLDPMALWQEIRHLIKGSAKATENKNNLITEEDYQNHRHLTTLPNSNPQQIYNLSLQYQSWLISQGFWDEIDLTHTLLANLPCSPDQQYEAIYCDEVGSSVLTVLKC